MQSSAQQQYFTLARQHKLDNCDSPVQCNHLPITIKQQRPFYVALHCTAWAGSQHCENTDMR